MTFKNVIFDLGGVFLNLDFARTRAAFRAMGTQRFDDLWSPAEQADLFESYEKGLMDDAAFRQGLRSQLQLQNATDADLDKAWNAMLLDIPAARLNWLVDVGQRFRVFLLSNTNQIHLAHIHTHCLPKGARKQLAAYFETAYYSCDIKHRKPEPAAFVHVLEREGLPAAETIFIDDLPINVEAAKNVGLEGRLITPKMSLSEALPEAAT